MIHEIALPASKSLSNRALILAHLANCTEKISNLSPCDDTKVMLKAFENLSHNLGNYTINIENAGTAMRFLTAFLAQREGEYILKGNERMCQRPIGVLVEALKTIGADITYMDKEGYPPLKIVGKKLKGGKLDISGETSSQFISALLMIAPYMSDGLTLYLKGNVVSLPYIKMTTSLMQHFGVETLWRENTLIVKPQTYHKVPYKIENDWSAASYWYALVSLSPDREFLLRGLERNSWQGDSVCVKVFEELGVSTHFNDEEHTITIHQSPLHAPYISYDCSQMPDLVQTFVPICCLRGVHFSFSGLQTLRIKETDRIKALIDECGKLGYTIENPEPNVLEWRGETTERKDLVIVSTYNDHRMAMGFAPFLLDHSSTEIEHPEVVSKSYPNFWEEWQKATQEL